MMSGDVSPSPVRTVSAPENTLNGSVTFTPMPFWPAALTPPASPPTTPSRARPRTRSSVLSSTGTPEVEQLKDQLNKQRMKIMRLTESDELRAKELAALRQEKLETERSKEELSQKLTQLLGIQELRGKEMAALRLEKEQLEEKMAELANEKDGNDAKATAKGEQEISEEGERSPGGVGGGVVPGREARDVVEAEGLSSKGYPGKEGLEGQLALLQKQLGAQEKANAKLQHELDDVMNKLVRNHAGKDDAASLSDEPPPSRSVRMQLKELADQKDSLERYVRALKERLTNSAEKVKAKDRELAAVVSEQDALRGRVRQLERQLANPLGCMQLLFPWSGCLQEQGRSDKEA
eukprot:TRINITY_DN10995_c0_g2_i1.p1 TRINITY_DN10995_c0_g2~~TRINITY_DN10995_c0_g2_i1.p1  ORF type:complete len:350 (-),score=83.84 TRINITY_DN10995_c0_g2_i1:391-1440(-)